MVVSVSSRSDKRAKTRGDILDAAATVFGDKDIADARVEDILNQAGVSRRTFYQHFANKAELAASLMERAISDLISRSGELQAVSIPVADKVARTVEYYLLLWHENGRVIQAVTREAQRTGSLLAAQRHQMIEAMVNFIHGALAGEGIAVSRLQISFAVLGAEAVMMHLAQSNSEISPELQAQIVTAVQRSILPNDPAAPSATKPPARPLFGAT